MNPSGKGGFKKGHDPRRHKLTREERQRGYDTTMYNRSAEIAAWFFRKLRHERKNRGWKPTAVHRGTRATQDSPNLQTASAARESPSSADQTEC